MDRNTINISGHIYCCDVLNYEENNIMEKFIMYRDQLFSNNIVYDNSLYFVAKNRQQTILWPISGSEYSVSYDENDYSSNPFISLLYDQNMNEKYVKCKTVRIWNPIGIENFSDIIIKIKTYINGIETTLLCDKLSNGIVKTYKEFTLNNVSYCQYTEFYIPDMNDLLSSQTLYIENMYDVHINNEKYKDLIIDNDNQYCSFLLYNFDSIITENSKTFLIDNDYKIDSYNRNILSLSLIPYNETDEKITLNDTYFPETIAIQNTEKIYISCKPIIIDGKLKLEMNFNWPLYKSFDTVKDAYEYYNNILLENYDGIYWEPSEDGYDEAEDHKQYQCVYGFELANDIEFKSIIYKSSPNAQDNTLSNNIEDKFFDIPLFNSWESFPDILLARCYFIDRYLGNVIYSNYVLLTQEEYKYLVKDSQLNKIINMGNIIQLNDKIECIVKNVINDQDQKQQQVIYKTKIIYKPVFYKVQDLEQIQLNSNTVQNIGIDLGQYMSKIESFYIKIGSTTIIESARNDNFVIFKIDSSNITDNTGRYDILDQDGQYISSGQLTIV